MGGLSLAHAREMNARTEHVAFIQRSYLAVKHFALYVTCQQTPTVHMPCSALKK